MGCNPKFNSAFGRPVRAGEFLGQLFEMATSNGFHGSLLADRQNSGCQGNRQMLSSGNLAANDRVCLFLMDYPQRTRLKIPGPARVEDARRHPGLVARFVEFLRRKWNRELDYRLKKELLAFGGNRIAVCFEYEYHDDSGQWYRAYGNQNWEFDELGYMKFRYASINDLSIQESERKFR
jgi:hypothetical protein